MTGLHLGIGLNICSSSLGWPASSSFTENAPRATKPTPGQEGRALCRYTAPRGLRIRTHTTPSGISWSISPSSLLLLFTFFPSENKKTHGIKARKRESVRPSLLPGDGETAMIGWLAGCITLLPSISLPCHVCFRLFSSLLYCTSSVAETYSARW